MCNIFFKKKNLFYSIHSAKIMISDKRPRDSTTSTTCGQIDTTSEKTDTTSGQTSTTSGQTSTTSGQTGTTSGQTSTASGKTNTSSERRVLRVVRQVILNTTSNICLFVLT